jgi:hypothetical protein
MWGHLEFKYKASNWTAPGQINVYGQTVMSVAQRENKVSCIHYVNDIVEHMEKWATNAQCIPNEIW